MKTILVLILAFPLILGAAGMQCPDVRSLEVEAACGEAASGTRLIYDMCMETLHEGVDPEPSVEVTVYALQAARSALRSYVATAEAALELLNGTSLDGDARAAYETCVVDYGYAENCMQRVANDMLPSCRFGDLVNEYMNGLVHLESCRDRLMWLTASPLYARNLVDRNKELLAYSIAKLLGI